MQRLPGSLIGTLQGAVLEESRAPYYVLLCRHLRSAILEGALAAGERLPSTRTLASDLGVSRTTVEAAYAQLSADGFITRHVGAGSYVTGHMRPAAAPPLVPAAAAGPHRTFSRRGKQIAAGAESILPLPTLVFSACMPSLEAFPAGVWNRLLSRQLRKVSERALVQTAPAGDRMLREAVAAHAAASRGVRCSWEQVLILSSTQQALDLSARLLMDPGDACWIEEPGYLGARGALMGAGARLIPIPVDRRGIDVAHGERAGPGARLAYVSPSSQYPLGASLALERRLALLAWAQRTGAWILEDDYDSEFRPPRAPVMALQGLGGGDRVLYMGTFNKVLFPGLRLAFLIVPAPLAEGFGRALAAAGGAPSSVLQLALADFMAEGHLAAHVRRVRQLYRSRREAFLERAQRVLGPGIAVDADATGLQVILWLPDGSDDVAVSRAARQAGLDLPPVSRMYLGAPGRAGLVVSDAGERPDRVEAGLASLARILAGIGMA